MTTSALLGPLVVLAALLGSVTWVHEDARRQSEDGTPVIFWMGALRIDTPAAWSIGCLVLWVFFFPLYLRARKN